MTNTNLFYSVSLGGKLSVVVVSKAKGIITRNLNPGKVIRFFGHWMEVAVLW